MPSAFNSRMRASRGLHPMPAELHAFGLRPCEAGIYPFADHAALEFGEHT